MLKFRKKRRTYAVQASVRGTLHAPKKYIQYPYKYSTIGNGQYSLPALRTARANVRLSRAA
ncbi:hypothetical protein ANACOL_00727 [Anaerotruncus colihominis DSM 17241]|uniref:Uncharacterized protein n=1 Tax=Anaerotruncus colihominis DSM 17241 TaxID=445972 RepID=B0P7J2_9FIRM|nr:hypothetical protein ANACOL_00727 [Anaerotruncus colihominis DSM 17241]